MLGAVAVLALAVAGCNSSGRYSETQAPAPMAVERLDKTITYAVDPALDGTVMIFECGLGGSATYDFLDAFGRRIRDVFERRYVGAAEVAPEAADVVVGYSHAVLDVVAEPNMFTYDAEFKVTMTGYLLWANGSVETFTASGSARDDFEKTFFDICRHGADMIGRLTPVLLGNLADVLAHRLD